MEKRWCQCWEAARKLVCEGRLFPGMAELNCWIRKLPQLVQRNGTLGIYKSAPKTFDSLSSRHCNLSPEDWPTGQPKKASGVSRVFTVNCLDTCRSILKRRGDNIVWPATLGKLASKRARLFAICVPELCCMEQFLHLVILQTFILPTPFWEGGCTVLQTEVEGHLQAARCFFVGCEAGRNGKLFSHLTRLLCRDVLPVVCTGCVWTVRAQQWGTVWVIFFDWVGGGW